MIQDVVIQVINAYIPYLAYSCALFYIFSNCYPLKVSKRKAYIIAFLYANYTPLTDVLGLVLIGGGLVEHTGLVYILTKINLNYS